MTDDDKSQLEVALNTLTQITEKSGNLRKVLKMDTVKSVNTLRNIFTNLNNCGEERFKEIFSLGFQLNRAIEQLRNSRVADITGHAATSRTGAVETSVGGPHRRLLPSGWAKETLL